MLQTLLKIIGWLFIVYGLCVVGFEINLFVQSDFTDFDATGRFNAFERKTVDDIGSEMQTFATGLIMLGVARLLNKQDEEAAKVVDFKKDLGNWPASA